MTNQRRLGRAPLTMANTPTTSEGLEIPIDAEDKILSDLRSDRLRAIDQIFELCRKSLHGYLSDLLKHREDVEELVQETYLSLIKAEQLDPAHSRVRSYVFRVATNLAFDRFRERQARSGEVSLEGSQLVSGTPEPDYILELEQSVDAIKKALGTLPPRCRQVFLLRSSERMGYAEIAKRLGTSKRTVERDMRLALDVCQQRLSKRDHT
jgi:RNA polymerase sigma-70 factor (ECF subfamily)